jgi:hypothetical protein
LELIRVAKEVGALSRLIASAVSVNDTKLVEAGAAVVAFDPEAMGGANALLPASVTFAADAPAGDRRGGCAGAGDRVEPVPVAGAAETAAADARVRLSSISKTCSI